MHPRALSLAYTSRSTFLPRATFSTSTQAQDGRRPVAFGLRANRADATPTAFRDHAPRDGGSEDTRGRSRGGHREESGGARRSFGLAPKTKGPDREPFGPLGGKVLFREEKQGGGGYPFQSGSSGREESRQRRREPYPPRSGPGEREGRDGVRERYGDRASGAPRTEMREERQNRSGHAPRMGGEDRNGTLDTGRPDFASRFRSTWKEGGEGQRRPFVPRAAAAERGAGRPVHQLENYMEGLLRRGEASAPQRHGSGPTMARPAIRGERADKENSRDAPAKVNDGFTYSLGFRKSEGAGGEGFQSGYSNWRPRENGGGRVGHRSDERDAFPPIQQPSAMSPNSTPAPPAPSDPTKWAPTKKLTFAAMVALRLLHQADPKLHNRAALGEKFGISYDAVGRILRSRFEHEEGAKREGDEERERQGKYVERPEDLSAIPAIRRALAQREGLRRSK